MQSIHELGHVGVPRRDVIPRDRPCEQPVGGTAIDQVPEHLVRRIDRRDHRVTPLLQIACSAAVRAKARNPRCCSTRTVPRRLPMMEATSSTPSPPSTRRRITSAWSGGRARSRSIASSSSNRETASSSASPTAPRAARCSGSVGMMPWRARLRRRSTTRRRAIVRANARSPRSSPSNPRSAWTTSSHVSDARSSASVGSITRRYRRTAG